jgi:molecular chaperone GrpE
MADKPQQDTSAPDSPEETTEIIPPADAELAALQEKADKNWDLYLRTMADLENYRKRAVREKEETGRYASERVVAALLPVLDNLERAIAATEEHGDAEAKQSQTLLEGVKHVQSQFRRALEEFGLQEVIAHAGLPFDPNVHEAVGHVQSDEHPEGAVLNQLQRGYKMADRLLRPARVVVSKGPAAKED